MVLHQFLHKYIIYYPPPICHQSIRLSFTMWHDKIARLLVDFLPNLTIRLSKNNLLWEVGELGGLGEGALTGVCF